jgi:predicted nucleic acid-binding protein
MSVFAFSALVKLYADEADSTSVRALHGPFRVSALARVEVPAALARKYRTGELSADDMTLLIDQFTADFHGTPTRAPLFTAVAVTGRVLNHAAALATRHGLRAYDAVQLASAITARQADSACDAFACFDKNPASAAQAEGFMLVP